MAYYMIKCKISDYVLDVEKGGGDGHRVIPWDRQESDNQIWYDDEITGTIRTKSGNYCLDVDGDQLVVRMYKQGDSNQQWFRQGPFIKNRLDNGKVLDIYKGNKDKGAKIGPWDYNGEKNQKFEFLVVGGLPAPAPVQGSSNRRFYIVSELSGKVLDISGGDKDEGAKVITWDKHAEQAMNQLWYVDSNGYIRSALNDLALCGKRGDKIRTKKISGDPASLWFIHGSAIMSRSGDCLDIKGGDKGNGATVLAYEYQTSENQHWRQEFV